MDMTLSNTSVYTCLDFANTLYLLILVAAVP